MWPFLWLTVVKEEISTARGDSLEASFTLRVFRCDLQVILTWLP